MGNIVLPALSEDAWVFTDQKQADYLFSHFFLTNYSQTQLYLRQVTSFAWIIQNNLGNMSKTQAEVQGALETYFGRFFPQVDVEVMAKPHAEKEDQFELYIYLSFTGKDGNNYNLAKLARIQGSKIKSVVNLNNYGEDISQSL